MRISYGRLRGSGYNARTGNNVSICPEGAKRPNSHKKIKKFVGYLPTYKIFFFLRLTTYRYCTVGSDPVKNARTGSLIGPETMIYKLNILYRYYDNCRLSISHTALNFYLTSLKVRKNYKQFRRYLVKNIPGMSKSDQVRKHRL